MTKDFTLTANGKAVAIVAEPSGASEATIRAISSAIGNAIFEATGVRLRHAPLNGARFKSMARAMAERGEKAI